LVAGELGNPAKNVKIAAIHVLELMGRDALADSEPRLRALTQSSSEPVEVKTAANEALKKIAH
jgi:hypothetical protein